MGLTRGGCTAAILTAVLMSAAGAIAANGQGGRQAARWATFATLPDWTGLWEMGRPGGPGPSGPGPGGLATPGAAPAAAPGGARSGGFGPPAPNIPYNVEWQQKLVATRARLAQIAGDEQEPDTTVTRCIWGIPRIYQGPYQFDVKLTPEVVVFTYDVGEYRRIWTDGRAHPAATKLALTNMGHSIGYWDSDTLVIDTIGLRPDVWVASNGATLSANAHVTERWRINEAGRLSVVATIGDPARLTGTYQVSNSYGRVTDTNRIVQQSCYENVREVQIGDHVITQFGAGK
jgi:hypothetical protein